MKAFPWFATAAFGLLAYVLWGTSLLVLRYLQDFQSLSALPALTQYALVPATWILFCPLPWLIWATVLSFRRELKAAPVFVFAGTILLAMVLVFCAVVLAAVLPIIPMKGPIGR